MFIIVYGLGFMADGPRVSVFDLGFMIYGLGSPAQQSFERGGLSQSWWAGGWMQGVESRRPCDFTGEGRRSSETLVNPSRSVRWTSLNQAAHEQPFTIVLLRQDNMPSENARVGIRRRSCAWAWLQYLQSGRRVYACMYVHIYTYIHIWAVIGK